MAKNKTVRINLGRKRGEMVKELMAERGYVTATEVCRAAILRVRKEFTLMQQETFRKNDVAKYEELMRSSGVTD